MSRLKKHITLLVTLVFFYSATGHAFVLHYCSQADSGCTEATCCTEEDAACSETAFATEPCCFESTQYLVNPHTVRQPVSYEIKKDAPEPPAVTVTSFASLFIAGLHPVPLSGYADFLLPDKDILATCRVLLI